MDGTSPPLCSSCEDYSCRYAKNPSIKRAIAASTEMETMIRQIFGSCISGDEKPEKYARAPPMQGPVTGMIIQAAVNDHDNFDKRSPHNRSRKLVNSRDGSNVRHGGATNNNKLHLMHVDDDMSAITALTLEEMEKINKQEGISKLAEDLIMEAKYQRYLEESKSGGPQDDKLAQSSVSPCEPSSRFEPKLAVIEDNIYAENQSTPTTRTQSITPKGKASPIILPKNPKDSKSASSKQSHLRIVTPPKRRERCPNVEMLSNKSSSSRSSKSGSSQSVSHPSDDEMKCLNKMHVKSPFNTCRSKREDRRKLLKRNTPPNVKKNKSDRGVSGSISSKVNKMQIFDGTALEFSENEKFGEI